MSKLRRARSQALIVALWLGAFLLLSCQPTQPVATPQPAEKAAATAKPAEKAAEKPVRGGTLRISQYAEMATLDIQQTYFQVPFGNIYEPLILPDKDGNLTKEGLAKDWTVSGDGKSITFKLRGGVKFHDGTDLDAAAVKFNIERLKDPATKSPYRIYYNAVGSVDIVDSLTVRFNLKQPDPLLLPRLGNAGSMMVSPAAVQKLGQDFGRKPVGSGPFQLVEWAPGDRYTLKRFDGYWGKDQAGNQLPYLDGVVFPIITDSDVALANLRAGQLDVYNPGLGFPPEQLSLIKGDANLTYSVEDLIRIYGVNLNTVRPPFDKKALRQAVALAVDREGIAARLGEVVRLNASLLYPRDWAYDGKAGVFPARDLAKAKAKMAEAGYPGGLKVKYSSRTDPNFLMEAQIVKANLAEIGIDVEIEALGFAAWLAKASTVGGDYQISAGGTAYAVLDPGDTFTIMYHSQGSRNYFGPYSNPKVDQLIDKAGSIYDQKERTALYREAANIMADDAFYVPLYLQKLYYAMNKKVRDFPESLNPFARSLGRVWLAK